MLVFLRRVLLAVLVCCVPAGLPAGGAAATELFDELRTFSGTVLVPPDGTEPFAGLKVYRLEIGRVRGSGPARGRYVIQYRDGLAPDGQAPDGQARGLGAGQAQLAGTIGRDDFDEAAETLANLSFPRCAPDAAYCTENVGGQDGAELASELFRGLSVNDGPAIVEHVTCRGGHYWTLTWFDVERDMTYELVLVGALADDHGRELGEDNLSAALALAELAGRLEPLR